MAGKNGKQSSATIDFKEFRKERRKKQKPIVVDFGDEKLELPAQMPASVMLHLMAFNEEQTAQGKDGDFADMPPDLAMSIMAGLIGTDRIREVAQRQQMDIDELIWLMEQLMSHYMADVSEAQSGNATARPVPVST